jgi:hypothetical protein
MIKTIQIYNLTMGTLESGYIFGNLTGFGFPSLKVDIKERGSTHGADLGVSLYGRRVMGIELEIIGKNTTDYETKRRALELACDITRGLQRIYITTRSGIEVICDAIVTGDFDLPYTKGQMIFSSVRLELTAPYPFFSSKDQKSSLISLWSGGGWGLPFELPLDMSCGGDVIANVVNSGNTKSYPVITLYGQLEDATLTNETNGETFSIDYEIADASQVVIDTFNRTIILNGTTNLRQYFSGDWLSLDPGGNGIKLTATTYGYNALVLLTYRDSYLGL